MTQRRSRAFAALVGVGVLFLWLTVGIGAARADESPAADPSTSSASAPDSSAGSSSAADTASASDTATAPAPSPTAETAPGPTDTVVDPGPTSSTPVIAINSSAGDSTALPDSSSSSSTGSAPTTIDSSTDSPPGPTAAQVAAANASAGQMRSVVQTSIPALINSVQSAAGGGCAQCDAAIAVSVGGDSWAGAANPASTATGTASPDLGTTQNAGGAGSTGGATAVSISADGDATADAAPGAVGGTAETGVTAAAQVAPARAMPVQAQRLVNAITDLMHGLLDASGSAASTFKLSACGTSLCISGGHASAQIATTAGGAVAANAGSGTSCWSASAACSIVVSIAIRGTAHVSLPVGGANAAAASDCSAQANNGTVGAANAIAVSVRGDAHASIEVPRSSDCVPAATTQTVADLNADTTHSAVTGATGDSLSIAMTAHGTASALATSGNSGKASAAGGVAGTAGGTDTELARTGLTGAAVGVAIAKLGAMSQVHSGNSGSAVAICSGCGGGQDDPSYTQSISGDTGISFVVAVAGRQAYVQSQTGDSGQAISWVVDHSGAGDATRSPGTGSSGAQQSSDGGLVSVSGHSGATGNVIVIAVGPHSSVEVWSHSGYSGPVHSIATWGLGTCTVDIAAFQVVCPTAGKPAPGGKPIGTDKDTTTPKQKAGSVKIVISPGDPGGPQSASAATPGPQESVVHPVSSRPTAATYQGGIVPAAAQQRSRDNANLVTRVALIAGAAILPTLLLLWWVISRGDGEAWPSISRMRRRTDDQ